MISKIYKIFGPWDVADNWHFSFSLASAPTEPELCPIATIGARKRADSSK
jgi:hypothetical protein